MTDDEYLKYASKLNFSNLAISDFETFRGVPHFVHECQKYNIKPIIGIDLIIEGLLFKLINQFKRIQENYCFFCKFIF